MSLSRDEAWAHLVSWTPSESLRLHARAVEIVMIAAAARYGEPGADAVRWGICGMLHDADYDQWPEEHPSRIVGWLKERGDDDLAHAISGHYTHWGVPWNTPMDKALLACDELTGFVVACCYIRPEGVSTLTPKSVKKKLKSKGFASGVDRFEVQKGLELLDIDNTSHIQFIIDALRPHAEELGIGPKSRS